MCHDGSVTKSHATAAVLFNFVLRETQNLRAVVRGKRKEDYTFFFLYFFSTSRLIPSRDGFCIVVITVQCCCYCRTVIVRRSVLLLLLSRAYRAAIKHKHRRRRVGALNFTSRRDRRAYVVVRYHRVGRGLRHAPPPFPSSVWPSR